MDERAERRHPPEEGDEPCLGIEIERAGRAADLAEERLVLRAGERERRGLGESTESPSRQPFGTRRTSGTSPTAPTTGVGWIARPFVSL